MATRLRTSVLHFPQNPRDIGRHSGIAEVDLVARRPGAVLVSVVLPLENEVERLAWLRAVVM